MRKAPRATCAMPVQQISVNPMEWSKDVQHGIDEAPEWREAILALSGGNPVPPERCMSQASTLSNSYDICRICHCEGERDAPLIAPCYCSGSLRYVHQACLQQWIKSSDIRACELCKFQFVMYSKIKPIMQWEQLELSALERRKLLCMVLFHTAALSCVLWSLHVLIDGTLEEINKGLLEWSLWTKLIGVTAVFSGGVAYIFHQGKAYCALCRRWRAFNRVIYVQNAPEKVALGSLQNVSLHQTQCSEAANALLTSGGCCGVETESAVADMRDNIHERNTSIDLHQDPATSTSHSNKSDSSMCKQDSIQEKRMWFRSSSVYNSKDNLGACSKSGSLNNDDISISSFDELTSSCLRSSRNSINEDMEPLPPPAAFVDSATNTELVYENEKLDGKSLSKQCSSSSGSPVLPQESLPRSGSSSVVSLNKSLDQDVVPGQSFTHQSSSDPNQEKSSDSKVSSAFMLGSGLTYSRPTRVGYPYLLSTFHPMIPPNLNVQNVGRSGSSSSSSSEECVASLMRQTQSNLSKPQQTRPWTVGGPDFLQSTNYDTSDEGWNRVADDIRSDRSGIRSATVRSETAARFQCPSGSQSPLLSAAQSHSKTK
ncbi:hypothetical protein FOCC_FOCC001065 [Frankliniella occidentalis]|uniref:Uncharacterized protein LOC113210022 isoform X1 n=1 Tax=Frankliniella occidentalis TaxID=133901 RepID=A0A6J1SQP3_FRAOC|nr:uncharacterized protein LOC113210022 isoform X1 [Frankliniella occidentalis]XP_052126449.1 uncharacterized protein LOC113210022 isoform X1 [Frankliniella occidentalis]XP_052126455.1 uncharacterized protein LOC113210022 isoform X2 [Frankliniella occidentalis]KAE8752272.1 hypothetical protein FOCC_FOCC001065 [Frankliniella occidentalis]